VRFSEELEKILVFIEIKLRWGNIYALKPLFQALE
jgi:hypothetical protein